MGYFKTTTSLFAITIALAAAPAAAQDGLLFHMSADEDLTADVAQGEAEPNFASHVSIRPDGRSGGYIEAQGAQTLTWEAPGNIQAQRGTLSFFWRSREPVGRNEFPIFRVSYSDHSSWDMVWLRIDWNGAGFDAFVTDTNLSRSRVSWRGLETLDPDRWVHIAFAWDETTGVQLYIDGELVGEQAGALTLDAGLDQMGPHSRIISPYQVQSRYNFMRGGDLDELKVHDRALSGTQIAALARGGDVETAAPSITDDRWTAWRHRLGFDGEAPPAIEPYTAIRKVEFDSTYDLQQRFLKGSDGVRESTWPGVYYRSRLPGRHDYFEIPDWNVYFEGGRAITFNLPEEPWNRLEFTGAADGTLTWVDGDAEAPLATRSEGPERTTYSVETRTGGSVRFDNRLPETPIQEFAAYNITTARAPDGASELSYVIDSGVAPDYPALGVLTDHVAGRHPAEERATVVAVPAASIEMSRPSRSNEGAQQARLPLVHVMIPYDFRDSRPGEPAHRGTHGWINYDGGLDGIQLDLPPLDVTPTHGGLYPLNIRIKDPLWPERDLLDVNVSIEPNRPYSLWLDTRDRILPNDASLYLTLAGAGEGLTADSLNGAGVRLVFKSREEAETEHVADRFEQVRDNLSFLVEERPQNRRLRLHDRYMRDLEDILRVDPDHDQARFHWAETNPGQPWPVFEQAEPPEGTPVWAFRQMEHMRLLRHFMEWWIDNRQAEYGDFGGGLSDDSDLTNQWPGAALLGLMPDKITRSHNRMTDAIYRLGMVTDGLPTIRTDELHVYEEGQNADAQALYINWGDPTAVERLMDTARNYSRIIEPNAAGHTHFVSSYFSATDVVREGIWEWSKPHSYLILHAALLLGEYNGDPTMRSLVTAMADHYLAHGTQDAEGNWSFPAEINWRTDEARGSLEAGDIAPYQMFWAAWRWTGDDKYLAPLETRVRERGPGQLSMLNANALDALGRREDWGQALVEQANERGASGFPLYAAWEMTGDRSYLERLYGDEVQRATQRMFMMTEGHWWSDRVEVYSEFLQRARLGGMALRRNQTFPGHTVSWRFVEDGDAENVAILMPGATPDRFTVIAFNGSDREISAEMTGWNVTGGRWSVRSGTDSNGDDAIDGRASTREVLLESSRSTPLTFAPGVTTIHEFTLTGESDGAVQDRPDLAIGPRTTRVENGALHVQVFSQGVHAAPAATVLLEDASGREIARGRSAALAAADDLTPKSTEVMLDLPAGFVADGHRVRLIPDGDPAEITLLNNEVRL